MVGTKVTSNSFILVTRIPKIEHICKVCFVYFLWMFRI